MRVSSIWNWMDVTTIAQKKLKHISIQCLMEKRQVIVDLDKETLDSRQMKETLDSRQMEPKNWHRP